MSDKLTSVLFSQDFYTESSAHRRLFLKKSLPQTLVSSCVHFWNSADPNHDHLLVIKSQFWLTKNHFPHHHPRLTDSPWYFSSHGRVHSVANTLVLISIDVLCKHLGFRRIQPQKNMISIIDFRIVFAFKRSSLQRTASSPLPLLSFHRNATLLCNYFQFAHSSRRLNTQPKLIINVFCSPQPTWSLHRHSEKIRLWTGTT